MLVGIAFPPVSIISFRISIISFRINSNKLKKETCGGPKGREMPLQPQQVPQPLMAAR